MPIEQDHLYELLAASFPGDVIKIDALADDNDHYSVEIISSKFEGKTRVDQHRLVNDALKGWAGDKLHALAIKTIKKSEINLCN